MSDVIKKINAPNFHAIHFTFEGRQYIFSGWWILDWITGDKVYDTIEAFLADPIFDGRRLSEIADSLSDVWYEFEP